MSNLKNETIADIMTEIVGRDAACRKPVTDCHGLNAAAMREALLEASIALSDATHHHMTEDDAKECLAVVVAALSAPPRNCDVGTADEQSDRFDKFCYSHSNCHKCPVKSIWNSQHRQKQLREIIRCEIIWSQMPYEGGGAE